MISRFPLTVLVLFAASVWALILAANGWVLPPSFFAPLSMVTGALSLLLLAFDRFAWRWRGIRVLSTRPDLRGTWRGTLKSDWVGESGKPLRPIKVFLVVHQTFTEIRMRMLSPEMQSITLAATILKPPGEPYSVITTYRSEPKLEVRERSPIHHGTLRLTLAGPDGNHLQGEYWTDRDSKGSIELQLVSRLIALDYETASGLESS